MLFYVTILAFALFNFTSLYSANSFHVTFSNFFLRFIPITALNAVLFFAYFFFFNYEYEVYALLGVFLVYVSQFVLFIDDKTKYKYAVSVYHALATIIPFYAMRLFFLGYFAYDAHLSIPVFLENAHDRTELLLYSLVFATLSKSFYLSRFCVNKVASIMQDYKNLAFLTRVLVAIYIHALFMSYYLFRLNSNSIDLDIFSIKVGVCYIAGYFIMVVYAIIFDRLSEYQQKLSMIKKSLHEEEKEIEKLQKEVQIDPTTGLRVRSVALEVINEYLQQKEAFYLIFVDMDGLKHANDVYGHEEGDFYIKSIASLLKEEFLSDTVVRFGGDEFLIVGEVEENDEMNIKEQIHTCREKALSISSNHHKPYPTSFSYGLIEVEADTDLSLKEILDNADKRMYEFKKTMKKTRQVIDIRDGLKFSANKEDNAQEQALIKNEEENLCTKVMNEPNKPEISSLAQEKKNLLVDEIPAHIRAIMQQSEKE